MTTSTYSYITLAEVEAALSLRLDDPGFVKFPTSELDLYIVEALRTFNALSGMWQQHDVQVVPAETAFIDLTQTFSSLRGQTIRDQELVRAIEYHLIEPMSVLSWTGTEMFSLTKIVSALQRRRDQFLLDTGCYVVRHAPIPSSPGTISASTSEVALDDTMIDVIRVCWVDLETGRTTPLWATSNLAAKAASLTWTLALDIPKAFSFNQRAPQVIQLVPPPAAAGTLDVISVDAGAVLDTTANANTGTLLGIPDDFAAFVKWGAMADLLSADGPAQDYARSLFCERKYQLGVAAAQVAPALVDAQINGQVVQVASMTGLDMAPTMMYWQARTSPRPQCVAVVGLNLLAIALPPENSASVELLLVRNAPVPVLSGDFVQIPREYLDAIIGYAEHLALFKLGGKELAATSHLAANLLNAAKTFNARLSTTSVFEDDQLFVSRTKENIKIRRVRREGSVSEDDPSSQQMNSPQNSQNSQNSQNPQRG